MFKIQELIFGGLLIALACLPGILAVIIFWFEYRAPTHRIVYVCPQADQRAELVPKVGWICVTSPTQKEIKID